MTTNNQHQDSIKYEEFYNFDTKQSVKRQHFF